MATIEYIRKQLGEADLKNLPCPDRYKVQMNLKGRSLSQWYADEMERLSKQNYQTLSNEGRIRLHRQMRLFLGQPVKALRPERSVLWQNLYYCDKTDRYYLYEYEVDFPADILVGFRQVEVQITYREEVIRHKDYEIVEAENEAAGKEGALCNTKSEIE